MAAAAPHSDDGVTAKLLHYLEAAAGDGGKDGFLHETAQLEAFILQFQGRRSFPEAQFTTLLRLVTVNRLFSTSWRRNATPDHMLCVMGSLRLLLRDGTHRTRFLELGGADCIAEVLLTGSEAFFRDSLVGSDLVVTMVVLIRQLAQDPAGTDRLMELGVHGALLELLTSWTLVVVHCALRALAALCRSPEARLAIATLDAVDVLLQLLRGASDNVTRTSVAVLLRTLAKEDAARAQIQHCQGLPLLLTQLQSGAEDVRLIMAELLLDLASEERDAIRDIGGIPLLLSVLSGAPTGDHKTSTILRTRVCSILAQLSLADLNTAVILEANGVYSIALLVLPHPDLATFGPAQRDVAVELQAAALRTLRFIFSVELNRRVFKRLFPPDLFEQFIDAGHYRSEIRPFLDIAKSINALDSRAFGALQASVADSDNTRPPQRRIRDFEVLEKLGEGSFGAVYRVRQRGRSTNYAMKEIFTKNPTVFGTTEEERAEMIARMLNEVKLIEENKLKHRNVVEYLSWFEEDEKLFLIMELAEGATLQDHFNSLREKRQSMGEARTWRILQQLVSGLRYIHVEKRIVHRDLTPSNVIVGWNDEVKIADFGLARVHSENTVMKSTVGTISYSCPEVIQSEPYGHKADVWALGCLLYQMISLEPPFFSKNMLTLAKSIVEGTYAPLRAGSTDPLFVAVVGRCLQPRPADRPDIVEVCRMVGPKVLLELDGLKEQLASLEQAVEHEKRRREVHKGRAQRHRLRLEKMFASTQNTSSQREEGIASPRVLGSSTQLDLRMPRRNSTPSLSAFRIPTPVVTSDALQPHSEAEAEDDPFGRENPTPPSLARRPFSAASSEEDADGLLASSLSSAGSFRSQRDKMSASGRLRPSSGSRSAISFSSTQVRTLDPLSVYLNQLHKVVYVTQLPPTLVPNPARYVIETYKRALFSDPQRPLKKEMQALQSGSHEVVQLGSAGSVLQVPAGDNQAEHTPVTYELLSTLIHQVLLDSGYYDAPDDSDGVGEGELRPPSAGRRRLHSSTSPASSDQS